MSPPRLRRSGFCAWPFAVSQKQPTGYAYISLRRGCAILDGGKRLAHSRTRKGTRVTETWVKTRAVGRSGASALRRRRGAARHRHCRRRFLAGFQRLLRELTPENKRLLARRDESAGADRRAQRRDGGPGARSGRGRGVPARDRLSRRAAAALHDRHDKCRSGDRRARRAAAGRPGQQRPLRAQRRSTPAGAASTTRSTAPTRSASLPPAGGYDPERGAR